MIAETEDDLIKRLNECKDNVENRGMRVNMNKTKVISGEWQKVMQKAIRLPCGVCGRGIGTIVQFLSKSSLLYLLVLHPPFHTPYISSPNHCLLFAAHAHTYRTCFAVVPRLHQCTSCKKWLHRKCSDENVCRGCVNLVTGTGCTSVDIVVNAMWT